MSKYLKWNNQKMIDFYSDCYESISSVKLLFLLEFDDSRKMLI
jgi:hypothetical protein